jgi:alkanesulfonate monooxygenase
MKNKLKIEWMLERSHDIKKDIDLIKLLDSNGFNSILIRTASFFPDPWALATHYASLTKNIKFLIAVNPSMISPVFCAIKVSTFQELFGDRISINVVSGASTVEQAALGDYNPIKDRYKRSAEFAQILKKLVIDGNLDIFNGEFYKIKDAEIKKGHHFEIVFAGSSDNTINLANKFGSVHYYAMESSDQYIESRNKINVESAIKSTIIVEPTSQIAWGTANELLKLTSLERIEELKKDLSSHESENQKRQQALHNFSKENLIVEDNIWAGMGLLRGGGIAAMVGNYEEVANLIEKFYNYGLDRILIAGTPELHYANNFINGVVPILKEKNIL